VNEEPEVDCDCPLHNPNGLPVTSLRLEAGNRLTLRAEAIIHTSDRMLILAFIAAHQHRYEHSPLTTLFLARDWFTTRGCEAEVQPVAGVNLFTRACTSARLAVRGFLWKRVGMALFQGQETCEDCAKHLHEQAEQMGTGDAT
jgi:hypothetical protein